MLLGLTIVMSFLGGVLEEKSGAIGGAMSRMPGGGTAIHQAEHSDKSFAGKSFVCSILILHTQGNLDNIWCIEILHYFLRVYVCMFYMWL